MSVKNPELTEPKVQRADDLIADASIDIMAIDSALNLVGVAAEGVDKYVDRKVAKDTLSELQEQAATSLDEILTEKEKGERSGMDASGVRGLQKAAMQASSTGKRGIGYEIKINTILNEQVRRYPGRSDIILGVGRGFRTTDNVALAITQYEATQAENTASAQRRVDEMLKDGTTLGVSTKKWDDGDFEGYYKELQEAKASRLKSEEYRRKAEVLSAEGAYNAETFKRDFKKVLPDEMQNLKPALDKYMLATFGISTGDLHEIATSGRAGKKDEHGVKPKVDMDEVRLGVENWYYALYRPKEVEEWNKRSSYVLPDGTVDTAFAPIDQHFERINKQLGATESAERSDSLYRLAANSAVFQIPHGPETDGFLKITQRMGNSAYSEALSNIPKDVLLEGALTYFGGLPKGGVPNPSTPDEASGSETPATPTITKATEVDFDNAAAELGMTKQQQEAFAIGLADAFRIEMNSPDYSSEETAAAVVRYVDAWSKNYKRKANLGEIESYKVSDALLGILADEKYLEAKTIFEETVLKEIGLNLNDVIGLEAKYWTDVATSTWIEESLNRRAEAGLLNRNRIQGGFFGLTDVKRVDIRDPSEPLKVHGPASPAGPMDLMNMYELQSGKLVSRYMFDNPEAYIEYSRLVELQVNENGMLRWQPVQPQIVGLTEFAKDEQLMLEDISKELNEIGRKRMDNWVKAKAHQDGIPYAIAAEEIRYGVVGRLDYRRDAGLGR